MKIIVKNEGGSLSHAKISISDLKFPIVNSKFPKDFIYFNAKWFDLILHLNLVFNYIWCKKIPIKIIYLSCINFKQKYFSCLKFYWKCLTKFLYQNESSSFKIQI
jgi:hypothetical protein